MKEQFKLKRRFAKRPQKDRVLIVCEGKTECRYLQDLKDHMELSYSIKIILSKGSSPANVVTEAERTLEDDRDFGKVYCVFDRDKHPSFKKALQQIQKLHDKYKSNTTIEAITSVPCFELWLLLHFNKYRRPSGDGAGSPYKKLVDELIKYQGFKRYKRDKGVAFGRLKGLLEITQSNSADIMRRHIKEGKNQHEGDPSTRMHILVGELRKLAEA